MLISPLPFEYIAHLDPRLDPGDRKRRLRSRPTGERVRRPPPKTEE